MAKPQHMKNTLRTLLIGTALAVASLPLGAATATNDLRNSPPTGGPSSDWTPPAPAKAKNNVSTPSPRTDVQPAPSGAPASDTLRPKASPDNGRASSPRPGETPSAPAGAPASNTPPPANR